MNMNEQLCMQTYKWECISHSYIEYGKHSKEGENVTLSNIHWQEAGFSRADVQLHMQKFTPCLQTDCLMVLTFQISREGKLMLYSGILSNQTF